MKKITLICIGAAAAALVSLGILAVASEDTNDADQDRDSVAALVGDKEILLKEANAFERTKLKNSKNSNQNDTALDLLIRMEIVDKMCQERNLTFTEEEQHYLDTFQNLFWEDKEKYQDEYDEQERQQTEAVEAAYNQVVAQSGLTREEYQALAKKMRKYKMQIQQLLPFFNDDRQELDSYLWSHYADYDVKKLK